MEEDELDSYQWKLHKKERKVFLSALGILEEEEEEKKENKSVEKRDKDLENGKLLPSVQSTITLQFFNQNISLRQDTHSCGGHLWRSATVLLRYLENDQVFLQDGRMNTELLRKASNNTQSNDSSFFDFFCKPSSKLTDFSSSSSSSYSNHFVGKNILELGAGTGLLGIALAKAGASVMLTDMKSLLPLLQENVHLNEFDNSNRDKSIRVQELFWGSTMDPSLIETPFDYIIASDCIYLEHTFETLLKTMLSLSDSRQTNIIVAYQKRRKADQRFWKLAQKRFHIYKVPLQLYSGTMRERVQIVHMKNRYPSP